MAKSEILKPYILSWEGGFVNDPNDRGKATNKGVTIGTFQRIFGASKTVEDLKKITDAQWTFIFKKYYWDKWKADEINSQSIANLLVDWYWHSGSYGIKIPQSVLKVGIDGIVGPKTIAAINNYPNEKELFLKLWKEREAFLTRLARGSQRKYLNGWLRRLNGLKYGKIICNGGKVIDY